MGKEAGKYINTQEYWELNYWLESHGYRETKENRTELVNIITEVKKALGLESSQNLSYDQLNNYYKKNPLSFFNLEEVNEEESKD